MCQVTYELDVGKKRQDVFQYHLGKRKLKKVDQRTVRPVDVE